MKLSNWGKYPIVDVNIESFSTLKQLAFFVHSNNEMISRGLGRCYGDSALSKNIISILKLNRILNFNPTSGELTCEAGISFQDILDTFVPKGWFLPVVPGTKFVTLGGAIAADIHGKNHHVHGCLSNNVNSIVIMLADGSIKECSKTINSDLFWATCGGMGLTGVIIQASLNLKRIETAYIKQEVFRCENLDAVMKTFDESNNFTYSVAWIDCLAQGKNMGRGIMIRGEHARIEEVPYKNPLLLPLKNTVAIPFNLPNFILNPLTIKMFNFFYYNKAPKIIKQSLIDYDTFFFPLDRIHNWNRIYGNRGFAQYQFVIPKVSSKEGLQRILDKISKSQLSSFLAVLKLFGNQSGFISFPMEGYTLSLDFPISEKLFSLLNDLDKIVNDYGGRIYLAKDVRISKNSFNAGYYNIEKFKEIKSKYDGEKKFQSLQSKRIGI